MPTPSLSLLERKLEAAKSKLARLQSRAFSLKKRSWQRQDTQVIKRIQTKLQKSV